MSNFLSAHWKNLLMLNYKVDAAILKPFLPRGTELDYYNGNCYASLVGFMFLQTRIKGIAFPFHTNFEEVNLRFYVKFKEGNQWKRGVVFVKEIVPKKMICVVANLLYQEHYYYMPMKNSLITTESNFTVQYDWYFNKEWNFLQATASNNAEPMKINSEEEFIAEHYWGYSKLNENTTSEYGVQHEPWKIHQVEAYKVNCNIAELYGSQFVDALSQNPSSVFVAAGSDIAVTHRRVLKY
jgi:uncharacterized protein YqjF (DUF2071 family)